jgi:curved DNA-binding protein CbpA
MSNQTQLPMTKKRAYQVLEIHLSPDQPLPANISLAKIREQYKICALKYHPDKCKLHNANQRFQEIQDAYEYLKEYSNPEPKSYRSSGEENGDGYDYDYENDDETPPDYKKMIGMYFGLVELTILILLVGTMPNTQTLN